MSGERLGGFEELVLLAVAGLAGEGYGVTIRDELEHRTRRSVSVGAVYSTLDRLERKGLVVSRLGAATPERGGRRKRLVEITGAGTRAITESRRLRDGLWQAIEGAAGS